MKKELNKNFLFVWIVMVSIITAQLQMTIIKVSNAFCLFINLFPYLELFLL